MLITIPAFHELVSLMIKDLHASASDQPKMFQVEQYVLAYVGNLVAGAVAGEFETDAVKGYLGEALTWVIDCRKKAQEQMKAEKEAKEAKEAEEKKESEEAEADDVEEHCEGCESKVETLVSPA